MSHFREDLAKIGEDTAKILRDGGYGVNGKIVTIDKEIDYAVKNSVLYRPTDNILPALFVTDEPNSMLIKVTPETTLAAAKRLKDKGYQNVVALNFASARHPGGGWLSGAPAQEESLARASALFPTINQFQEMYRFNDEQRSALYSNYMIYSPDVPVFRDDNHKLLEKPHPVSFITSPAPNAGAVQKNAPHDINKIPAVMNLRIRKILAVASIQKADALVLGAFGCGVFKNDPKEVATQFKDILLDHHFSNRFKEVIFAVYDRSPDKSSYKAFKSILS